MLHLCGCYYIINSTDYYVQFQKNYLPLLDSSAHTTILSTTSRTVLRQTFTNPSLIEPIKECNYTFPLYDGVSVVGFTCRIGKRVLTGLVKEKFKAKQIFDDAVAKGETAGLLTQAPEAADVFTTKLGNIPAGESIIVEVTYIGELKHTETEGIRFTIPTSIAPRYGSGPAVSSNIQLKADQGIKITVDINMPEGSFIKGVQSPSHPIAVSMGVLSTSVNADPTMSKASATLSLGTAALEKDFVLIVSAKDVGIPKALLETHPTIPNHRALMATLVPKFSLPPSRPEIVFVADRSGSMGGSGITMLISAMHVLLKSIPVGVKFNICSFGSSNSFLWNQSQPYSQETLAKATAHVNTFTANMGGTETHSAVKATIDRRFSDLPLEVMLLTDGDIWQQDSFFKYLNEQVHQSNGNIRVFPLGIGNGVSHALIEGVARAGNGFASAVQSGERLDNSVVRMLRGALSPHITDYTLEVKYEKQDDFEVVEKVTEGMRVLLSEDKEPEPPKATISLFDTNVNPEKEPVKTAGSPYDHLPVIPYPHLHQAPHKIPSLFAFSRASVYLLMSPDTIQRNPTAVILRATSSHGPLSLEIPIEHLPEPGTTIHQLAAKKAVQDLEEGRGWIYDAKDQAGKLVKERYPSCFQELVEKEAVRLGEKFQIAGKWTSFVAVASNDKEIALEKQKQRDGEKYSFEPDFDEEEEDYDNAKKKDTTSNSSSVLHTEEAPPVYSIFRGRAAAYGPGSVSPPPPKMSSSSASVSEEINAQILSIQAIVQDAATRGERLDTLAQSSDQLSKTASSFKMAKKSSSNPFANAVTGVSNLFGGSNGGVFGSSSSSAALNNPVGGFGNTSSPPTRGGGFGGFSRLRSAPTGSPQAHFMASAAPGSSNFGSAAPTPSNPRPALGTGPGNVFGGIRPGNVSSVMAKSDEPELRSVSLFGAAHSSPPPPPIPAQESKKQASGSPNPSPLGGMQQPQSTGISLFSSAPVAPAAPAPSFSSSDKGAVLRKSAPPKPTNPGSKILQSAGFRRKKESASSYDPTISDGNCYDPMISDDSPGLTTTERVITLISLQSFTGSWDSSSSSQISAIFGFKIPSPPSASITPQAWITILVIKVLEDKMSDEEGTWGLVVEKARDWLAGLQWGGANGDLAALEAEASKVVETNWIS